MSFTPPFMPRIGAKEYPPSGGVLLRVMNDLPLTPAQHAQVQHHFALHKLNLHASVVDYLVHNGELADGTRFRFVSNSSQHAIYVWPAGGVRRVVIPRVYSGVVRDGQIVSVDGVSVLRDFQPTQQCWEMPLHKSTTVPTGVFSDIRQLAIDPFGGPGPGNSKFSGTQASMFSGLMAKIVQIVLGYGRDAGELGLATTASAFNWKWDDCHGAAVGPDGTVWLLRVDHFNGVLAMPLPLMKDTSNLDDHEDVVRETVALLHGLPTGHGFPAALDAAITAGNVLRLLTAADLAAYFDKTPFSTDLGWSFNATGSQAHAIVNYFTGEVYPADFTTAARPKVNAVHYQIAFTFGELATDRAPGAPIADCSATFSVVEEAEMWLRRGNECPFAFYESDINRMVRPPIVVSTAADSTEVMEAAGKLPSSFPVHVCHVDGVLKVVRAGMFASEHSFNGTITAQYKAGIWSEDFSDVGGGYTETNASEPTETVLGPINYAVNSGFGELVKHMLYHRHEHFDLSTVTDKPQVGWWPGRARDSYVVVKPGNTAQEVHNTDDWDAWGHSTGRYTNYFQMLDGETEPKYYAVHGDGVPGPGSFADSWDFPLGPMTEAEFLAAVDALQPQGEESAVGEGTSTRSDVLTNGDASIKLVTERGTVLEKVFAGTSPEAAMAGGIGSGGNEDLLFIEPAFANVSVFGPNLHAVWTTMWSTAATPVIAAATGALLAGEPTAKPADPAHTGAVGMYPWKLYAFTGYI